MSFHEPLQALKNQAEEVKNVLANTVKQLEERGEKANELETKAEALNEKSKLFENVTKKLERKYWWKDKKWMILTCAAALVVIVIIIILFSTL